MIIQFFLSHPSKDNEVSLNAYVINQLDNQHQLAQLMEHLTRDSDEGML